MSRARDRILDYRFAPCDWCNTATLWLPPTEPEACASCGAAFAVASSGHTLDRGTVRVRV